MITRPSKSQFWFKARLFCSRIFFLRDTTSRAALQTLLTITTNSALVIVGKEESEYAETEGKISITISFDVDYSGGQGKDGA